MLSTATILDARLLIVDDQLADLQLLEATLKRAGYVSIDCTTDPTRVCALHRANHYDLILLDLQMPMMDGFQVMDGLMTMEKEGYLPVLAVTAYPDQKLRALHEGARDYISKPFELAEVLARVHNLLEVRLLNEAAGNHAKQLESLALKDPLTGLANRRLLLDRMSMALAHARRNQNAMAVLYLDLDEFKQINDTLGHGAGDALLKSVALRLTATVRQGDIVARIGGDEFVIVLWQVKGAEDAAVAAAKIIAAVSPPYLLDGQRLVISVSAGVAVYPEHGENAEALLKSADTALYEAKRLGKNTYRMAARAIQEAKVP